MRTEFTGLDLSFALDRLGRALAKRMGQGKPHRAEDVALTTQIPLTNVKKYRLGDATPSLHYWLRLVGFFGPDFLNELVEPVGIGGAHAIEGEANSLQMTAALGRAVATVTGHLEDGVICHRELAEQVELARQLVPLLGAFIARNDGRYAGEKVAAVG